MRLQVSRRCIAKASATRNAGSLSARSPVVQPDLFGEYSINDHIRQARLMYIVDAIHRIYGRDTLFFAIQGVTRPWAMRQMHLSARFTTRWSDILAIESLQTTQEQRPRKP